MKDKSYLPYILLSLIEHNVSYGSVAHDCRHNTDTLHTEDIKGVERSPRIFISFLEPQFNCRPLSREP